MRTSRLSAIVITAGLLGSGLVVPSLQAVAAGEPPRPVVSAQAPSISRGLIVKTTTDQPGVAVVDAADEALGGAADVVDTSEIAENISTVTFDETVPEEIAADVADEIAQRQDVVWAAPDTLRRHQAASPVTVNDPVFAAQRNLWDSTKTSPVGGYSIKAPAFWKETTGAPSTVVAVLDTGFVPHPDLDGQLVPGYDMVGADQRSNGSSAGTYAVAGDGNGRDADPTDPGDWVSAGACYRGSPSEKSSWHGTFITGQIAAKSDNGSFVAGVAPGVKVQPVRVLGRCGGYDSDILAGFAWAIGEDVSGVPANDTPAQVVNMSLGGTYDNLTDRNRACAAWSDVLATAADKDVTVVAAAGNEGVKATYAVPASCPNVIAVGATSLKGYQSIYSNYGSHVDISAPGGDTLLEGPFDSIVGLTSKSSYSFNPGAGYSYTRYEGTSMASPQVAAGAALIRAALMSRGVEATAEVVTAQVLDATQKFGPRNTAAVHRKYTVGSTTYEADVSCGGAVYTCGAGILDLSHVALPQGTPTISGAAVVGEPLTVATSFLNPPHEPLGYSWTYGSTGISDCHDKATCFVPREAAGKRISVTVTPNYGFSAFRATSAPSDVVVQGPEVTFARVDERVTYGTAATFTATVGQASTGFAAPGSEVELRTTTAGTIGSGVVGERGMVSIEVPGTTWTSRAFENVRVAFLGDGTLDPSSSSRQRLLLQESPASVSAVMSSTISSSSRLKVKITVSSDFPTAPEGVVSIDSSRSGRLVSYRFTPADKGQKFIYLPKLKPGRQFIRVRYTSDLYRTDATMSPSKLVTVR